MKALKGKVIIKRYDFEKVSEGGLVIPDIAAKKPQFGTVVAVGAGNTDVKRGDVIFFDHVVDKFQYEGEFYHCLNAEDVCGVVEE
jgi:chaperonin GroES